MKKEKEINYLKECFLLKVKRIDVSFWENFKGKINVELEDINYLFKEIISRYKLISFKKLFEDWKKLFNENSNLISVGLDSNSFSFKKDLYYKNKRSLITLGYNLIFKNYSLREIKNKYKVFLELKESLGKKKKVYSKETLKIILHKMNYLLLNEDYMSINKLFNEKDLSFYKTNTLRLVKEKDMDVIYDYAYELYEGSIVFDVDYLLAEKLFLNLLKK